MVGACFDDPGFEFWLLFGHAGSKQGGDPGYTRQIALFGPCLGRV
jgi:hypothetical protein